ncbi:hypothetical protein TNIN_14951 [Trichonephila inaurata madagascariensis]|uniref:Uncharacterized protein n=1 Tax=Trichonephila inaurata madagascariensis TaxID=2747483 RepID=A0A8X6YR37_9ARAC|nr:hypothetical protein TNIN_14951 [Trichonephila inaurata madagascariensis]
MVVSLVQVQVQNPISTKMEIWKNYMLNEIGFQEVYVPSGQSEGLDFAEFVRGKCGDDTSQCREGVVQTLGPLSLPHVGQYSLVLKFLHAVTGAAIAMPLNL